MRLADCTTKINSVGRLEVIFERINEGQLSSTINKFKNTVRKIQQVRRMNQQANISDLMTNNIVDQEVAKEQSSYKDYAFNPLITRYWVSIVLLFLVLFLVFVFFPGQGNKNLADNYICNSFFQVQTEEGESHKYTQCNNPKDNSYILLFYILYSLYFLCCFLQIKYGQSKERHTNLLDYSLVRTVGMYTIKFVPFLLELKIIIEWAMTKTSLTLTNWIKLEDIFIHIFIYQSNFKRRIRGREQTFIMKFLMGFGSFFAISMLLIFPLILFSNLNPIATPNKVNSFDYEFGFRINNSFYFQIASGQEETNIGSISILFLPKAH